MFGEISFHPFDIVVTALHQKIQIEPSKATRFRLSTECLGDASSFQTDARWSKAQRNSIADLTI